MTAAPSAPPSTPSSVLVPAPPPPMIDDVELTITRDPDPAVSRFDVELTYLIRWPAFAQLTNLEYVESWQLLGVDPSSTTVLYNPGPLPLPVVRSDGSVTTRRTKRASVESHTLDEDPGGLDEIQAEILLFPRYPAAERATSATVSVAAP